MHTNPGPRPHTDGHVQQLPYRPNGPNGPPPRPLKPRHSAPRPLFATAQHHQLRGFNPSPVEPLPRIDSVNASNEHAFAGRDVRRPHKLPLGVQALRQATDQTTQYADWPITGGLNSHPPASAPLAQPKAPSAGPVGNRPPLRVSRSVGEGLRRLNTRGSDLKRDVALNGTATPELESPRPSVTAEGYRSSFRSVLTTNSSAMNTSATNTERNSFATGNSSHSEFVNVYPEWPDRGAETDDGEEGDMSVEDVLGMYEDGFESGRPSMETRSMRSMRSLKVEKDERPASQPSLQPTLKPPTDPTKPNRTHRRSQSASTMSRWERPAASRTQRLSADIAASKTLRNGAGAAPLAKPAGDSTVPRDRYGFKKVSHHVSAEQYDAWDAQYCKHLERRRKKWDMLMSSYGLPSEDPVRFPPKSDKIKRYVRKGIPPHMRGAAWFWYAGGPSYLAKDPNLYRRLLEDIEHKGALTDNDREHIERDLNRTFPDNIRFKGDPPTTASDAQASAGGANARKSVEPEMHMVKALRRVLQAFAVHNPNIGYCQSLNFLAGLLLLFLDEDEVKAFTLLNIVTSVHLPGTHGVALEGANIDIAVLMSCIKDTLPNIWARIDDKGGGLSTTSSAQALRLPTVSLATTAWFMSLFVGTLPIECVLRVWDCLFFEGSKTLFRIALAIFKAGERSILSVSDPMEIFQVVQTIPRSMLDINGLMEVCFRRRGGFGHISQELIERRRDERRKEVREGVAVVTDSRDVPSWRTRFRSRTKG